MFKSIFKSLSIFYTQFINSALMYPGVSPFVQKLPYSLTFKFSPVDLPLLYSKNYLQLYKRAQLLYLPLYYQLIFSGVSICSTVNNTPWTL
jgi:hypothetical protein